MKLAKSYLEWQPDSQKTSISFEVCFDCGKLVTLRSMWEKEVHVGFLNRTHFRAKRVLNGYYRENDLEVAVYVLLC